MGSVSNGIDFLYNAPYIRWGAERGLPANNEWDQLLDKDEVYQFRSWNLANWIGEREYLGQDSVENYNYGTIERVRRLPGPYSFNRALLSFTTDDTGTPQYFRPVLEIVSAPGTELKTITFDLGADGHLGVNPTHPRPLSIYLGPITSATVVYTGSLTLPEITEANGFYYTGTGTGTLGWYDGTTFYAPGTAVNLVTGTTLTAGYGVDAATTPSDAAKPDCLARRRAGGVELVGARERRRVGNHQLRGFQGQRYKLDGRGQRYGAHLHWPEQRRKLYVSGAGGQQRRPGRGSVRERDATAEQHVPVPPYNLQLGRAERVDLTLERLTQRKLGQPLTGVRRLN